MSVENERYAVIALADGVSTCKEAREGAYIACSAITNLMSKRGDFFVECDKEKAAEFVLSHILYEIRKISENSGMKIEDYSSTIACVVVDKKTNKMFFFSLGDSMIITTQNSGCSILSMPTDSSYGCPVTTTKHAQNMANSGVLDVGDIKSVMICSDGMWEKFFDRNTMKKNIQKMIVECQYDEIEHYLESQEMCDDYSFISLQTKKRRKIA